MNPQIKLATQSPRSNTKPRIWRLLAGNLSSEKGTSVLEMALLTPLLLFLLLGIIEVGRYAELSILVANAARAGAQYGAQSLVTAALTNQSNVQQAAVNDASSVLTTSNVSISTWSCNSNSPTAQPPCPNSDSQVVYIQVNTTGTFSSLFHYPGIPSSFTVNGMAQMRVAQ